MDTRESKLQEIRKALESATPGPWTHSRLAYGYVITDYEPHNTLASVVEYNEDGTVHSHFENWGHNRHLIANAPSWLSYLLTELETAKQEKHQAMFMLAEAIEALERCADVGEQDVLLIAQEALSLIRKDLSK